MKNILLNLAIFTLTFASFAIHAEETKNNLEAHVHGVSELMIVAEGSEFEIQFKSPAMNLVGFEYQAKSSKETATVEKVASTLRQHDALFLMSDTNCKQTNTTVDLSKIIDADHHDNNHKNNSKDDKNVHHHDEHESHEEHDGNHSEIMATYYYDCQDSSSLPSITVNLFEFFTGIEEINTMWVNQTRQGAITLNPSYRIINF